MTLTEKKKLWLKAVNAYNNKKAIMSDASFDDLELSINDVDPKWLKAQGTGAKVDKKTEVALVEFMPSLTKFYPEKIEKRIAKCENSQIIMDKLDGSALQVVYERGLPIKVITRGDGTYGGDISFLIPHLNIPKKISDKNFTVLRCEAVMKARTFAAKYSSEAENARALVNGALNRMKPSPALKDTDIVVLGVYHRILLIGLKLAAANKFSVVRYEVLPAHKITKLLTQRRKTSVYDMDGLVSADINAMFEYKNADKPKWIWAYKENESIEDATKATVKQIIWQESRKGLLVPKIEINPVRLGGTTVTFATAHNAKWMIDRGIGPGAIVQIVRSGDVIPKIVGVVKKGKIQLPKVDHDMQGVHFVALERTIDADVRAIHHFFTTMGIEFIASKTIEKLHAAGITTVQEHLADYGMRLTRYQEAGISTKMCTKIYTEYSRVFSNGVLLRDLMVASNTMAAGIGERKLKAIEAHYKDVPNILAELVKGDEKFIRLRVSKVAGFKDRSLGLLIDSITNFRPWLRHALKHIKVRKPVAAIEKKIVKGKLRGQRISFTGYRDVVEETWIEKNGGLVVPFGAQTQILLFRPTGKASSKVRKAQDKGIQTLFFKDLK
jgi:NAD-dependent DNA ligase